MVSIRSRTRNFADCQWVGSFSETPPILHFFCEKILESSHFISGFYLGSFVIRYLGLLLFNPGKKQSISSENPNGIEKLRCWLSKVLMGAIVERLCALGKALKCCDVGQGEKTETIKFVAKKFLSFFGLCSFEESIFMLLLYSLL